MNAIPQSTMHGIVARINALRAASLHYIDTSETTPLTREWHAIKQDIDALMHVDAPAAWEMTGSWCSLSGDVEGAEAAFRRSASLGGADAARTNWMITRQNLGLFSAAQELFAELGEPCEQDFAAMVAYGFSLGAIERTAALIERGRALGFVCDEGIARQVREARVMLSAAQFSDTRAAHQLDAAGRVLRRHQLRPVVVPHASLSDGMFRGVTYVLKVPVDGPRADDLNFELVLEDVDADHEPEVEFDVHFQGVHA